MKRLITFSLLLGLVLPLFIQTANAEVIDVLRRKDTTTVISGLPAVTWATGKITTNGCDGATLTCQCGAMGDSLALGACNAGTTIAEDAATGMYNITVNAADMDGEKCVVEAVCGAAIGDLVVRIYTAQYLSYLDITSMTATQPAVKLTGNTSGQGILSTGGNAASGGTFVSGGGNTYGINLLGTGSGAGFQTQGGGSNGAGATFTGGATNSNGIVSTGAGTGHGIVAGSGSGATGDGIYAVSSATNGNGINSAGNGNQPGFRATGGAGNGAGAVFTGGATNSNGITVTGAGTGSGISSTGGATSGSGILATGGAPNGSAFYGAGTGAGTGFVAYGGATNGKGAYFQGQGSGDGLYSYGGVTGRGATIIGGATSGMGLAVTAQAVSPGMAIAGGPRDTAAGAVGLSISGGASTWNDPSGKGGSGVTIASGASHASATSWNPAISGTCTGTACNALALTPGATGAAISSQTTGRGFGANMLASFFSVDTLKTYADAVAGSVIYESSLLSGGMSNAQVNQAKVTVYSGTLVTAAAGGQTALLLTSLLPDDAKPTEVSLDAVYTAGDTLDVILQDSNDNSNWSNVVTFTQVTTSTSHQRKRLPGPLGKYVRAYTTTVGATVSYATTVQIHYGGME